MKNEYIKIGIVDDHTLFRMGLAGILKEFNELSITFELGDVQQMKKVLAAGKIPDIILMDINMPGTDGFDATLWVKNNFPQVKVLALSMFDDDDIVIKMIKCGAVGYVLKESKPRDLLNAIKTIYTKGVYLNEMVSGKLFRSVNNDKIDASLTQREIDFLRLCCSELTYKEIANALFVSPRTVDNYRDSLFLKLSLKSRTGLVLYAIQQKIFKV